MEIRQFKTRQQGTMNFSVVGLGTAPIGDLYAKLDEKTAISTVEQALACGVTLFDTSPHYGNGLAEVRLGSGLRHAGRNGLLVSSKIGRTMDPMGAPASLKTDVVSPGFAGGFAHTARFDYSYDGAMRSIEQSLLRTGLDRLDMVLIHDCDVWTHGLADVDQRFKEAMSGAYVALDQLRGQGVVGAIGVGLNEADMCAKFARTGDFDVMMMAGNYSLLVQTGLDDFLPLALEKKIGVMLAGVYNSGILAVGALPGARFNYAPAPPDIMDRVRRIEAICDAHSTTLRAAALQFAMAHPAVVSVVLGAVKPSEVVDNVAAATARVPAALWTDLKAAGLLKPAAPTPTN